ncbi:MAG: rhomboid family intramembrane serine protease [Betaproteobacteria bacterium]|nr:rhomboid family intramembrane serine protease [Betaproteobacteria bacterium]
MTRLAQLAPAFPAVGMLVLALCLPDAWHAWAEYDRAALIRGEWWRLWTGHWVHADTAHAVGGASAWLGLALVSCSPGRVTAALTLVIAPLLGAVLFWLPDVLPAGLGAPIAEQYRGTSGLLFVWSAYLLCAPYAAKMPLALRWRITLAGLLAAKLAWDFRNWLALRPGEGFAVAGEVHLLGAMLGALWALSATATSVQEKIAEGGAYNRG